MYFFPRRLVTRLALSLGIALILMLVLLVSLSLRVQEDSIQEQTQTMLIRMTESYASSLMVMLDTRLTAARSLAEHYDVEAHQPLYFSTAQNLFQSVWVISAQGDLVSSWPAEQGPEPGTDVSAYSFFSEVDKSASVWISEPHVYEEISSEPLIHLVASIWNEEEFKGFIVANLGVFSTPLFQRIAGVAFGNSGYF
ncbi:MAG: PDC sensor domain-containing protein [Idiomarina sp.]|nr:PDC sensor domain-containing protein [Idiomarina sp.]